jgi:hypothetical protein
MINNHKFPLQLNGKIQSFHHDRLAIVYIRQSTLQQVERHNESTKLQYALAEKAYDLGWPKDRVLIICEVSRHSLHFVLA